MLLYPKNLKTMSKMVVVIKVLRLLRTDNIVNSIFLIVHYRFTLHLIDNAGTIS